MKLPTCSILDHFPASARMLPALVALTAALTACSGSGDGSSSAPPPSQQGPLTGTWTISVSPWAGSAPTCGPVGLDGAELVLGDVFTQQGNGITYSVYHTEISGLDLDSRAEPGESMLDIVFASDGSVLFETGMYYWPAGDLTVDIHALPGFVGSWDESGFEVVWAIDAYAGDVISAVFDELSGEDEDVIDTFDLPVCEATILVSFAPKGLPATQESSLVSYVGGPAGARLSASFDPSTQTLALARRNGPEQRRLGTFPVAGDGSFAGRLGAGTISGQQLGAQWVVTLQRASDEGPELATWVLERVD